MHRKHQIVNKNLKSNGKTTKRVLSISCHTTCDELSRKVTQKRGITPFFANLIKYGGDVDSRRNVIRRLVVEPWNDRIYFKKKFDTSAGKLWLKTERNSFTRKFPVRVLRHVRSRCYKILLNKPFLEHIWLRMFLKCAQAPYLRREPYQGTFLFNQNRNWSYETLAYFSELRKSLVSSKSNNPCVDNAYHTEMLLLLRSSFQTANITF